MTGERTVRVVREGMITMDQALAWTVRAYDKEFSDATMVVVQIEQIMVMSDESDGEWRHLWNAAVSGVVSQERENDD